VNQTHEVVVYLYCLLLFTFAVVYEVKKMENPYKRKLLSQEDDDEGDRPSKRRGQDKKKRKFLGLKTNEAKQQFQANEKAKSLKEANAAKGTFLGMMAAATAGCGSGGSDDCGSDDERGDVEATSINNQSNDDDNDDAEIVMPHQDIEPGRANYLEGDLGENSECGNTQADSTSGPDEEATSGLHSDWYNTSPSRENKFGSE
jgi:hypothetical protein